MAIRNCIASLKSLSYYTIQQWNFRSITTHLLQQQQHQDASSLSSSSLLPCDHLPDSSSANSFPVSQGGALITHAHAAKVKFLGVFVGFVDDAKRRRQYDKALEKRRRVIHRLRQLQKQRQESWEKQVQRLALDAFTRAYRKTLNTLRSGSKAKQAIFDKASELGTKAALTLTDSQPLTTTADLKLLLSQEQDHFNRLGWDFLPLSVKSAYSNLMLSIDQACEDLNKPQPSPKPLNPNSKSHTLHIPFPQQADPPPLTLDSHHEQYYEDVMERVANPETLSSAYETLKPKLQSLSGKTNEEWTDLTLNSFHHISRKLRSKTYYFSPPSQIHVRKPGKDGSQRSIVVLNPRDQIVIEAIRAELERMYSPNPKSVPSTHAALKLIKSGWKGTTWFIHYNAPVSFGRAQNEALLRVLGKRVKDEAFLELVREGFKKGVVGLGDRGSRLSALLCDVYYRELDVEVGRLQGEMNEGSKKRNDAKGDGKSGAPMPYARVRYVRYGEEFLLGITGSKVMALEVVERVERFLRRELKMVGPSLER